METYPGVKSGLLFKIFLEKLKDKQQTLHKWFKKDVSALTTKNLQAWNDTQRECESGGGVLEGKGDVTPLCGGSASDPFGSQIEAEAIEYPTLAPTSVGAAVKKVMNASEHAPVVRRDGNRHLRNSLQVEGDSELSDSTVPTVLSYSIFYDNNGVCACLACYPCPACETARRRPKYVQRERKQDLIDKQAREEAEEEKRCKEEE
jgi:hypothetical protein